MSLSTLAAIYLLGGLTFLPLVLAAVLTSLWYLLPITDGSKPADSGKGQVLGDDNDPAALKEHDVSTKEHEAYADGDRNAGASATFAVLRSYHFPSAVAALNGRTPGNAGAGNATGGANANPDSNAGELAGSGGSESVYQSMYRTVFDRNRAGPQTTSSVLESSGDAPSAQDSARVRRKNAVNASVFYIVLRHGHLMLYNSQAQLEVRHVISLAHHSISLTDGEDDYETLPDADLFIKRTAIVLTPTAQSLANGHPSATSSCSSLPKPFYLFSSTCSEKEDFYHALLSSRSPPPIPQEIAPEDLIKLQSTLHSTSLTPETRAFNALVGRIFLSIHETPWLEILVRSKIEKKIARMQKPSFIASLAVKSIYLGDSAPVLSQPKLKDINISGDLTLGFDVRYTGGVQIVIAAVARLDLGPRFKARTVDLVLSTSLQRLSGKMLVRVKPPPSNRIWFCFDSMPETDIKVEPIVSTRQITYTFILRAIEERIRAVVNETLVKPNWDDAPFFNTLSQRLRGGIWRDEGNAEDVGGVTTDSGDMKEALRKANEKSMSSPVLPNTATSSTESLVASSGNELLTGQPSAKPAGNLKRRSVASLPLQHAATTPRPEPSSPPKPMRSPSFTSPAPAVPSVAVDGVSGVPVRSNDASLQPRTWRSPASVQGVGRKEAVDAVREVRDRSLPAAQARTGDSSDTATEDQDDEEGLSVHQQSGEERAGPRRTDSERSFASSVTSGSSRQRQRKTILAATAAATTAARNWGWNAIQNRKAQSQGGINLPRQPIFRTSASSSQASLPPDQPIGRGQPLPPPGTPLPGPQKGLFGGLGAVAGSARGSVKRKPVLPPRRTGMQDSGRPVNGDGTTGQTSAAEFRPKEQDESLGVQTRHAGSGLTEDEFGPWRENSGTAAVEAEDDSAPVALEEQSADADDLLVDSGEPAEAETEQHEETGLAAPTAPVKKKPPPLPARRTVDAPAPTLNVHDADTTPYEALSVPPTTVGAEETSHHSKEKLNGDGVDSSALQADNDPTSSAEQLPTEKAVLGDEDDAWAEEYEAEATEDAKTLQLPGDVGTEDAGERFAAGGDLDEDDFEKEQPGATDLEEPSDAVAARNGASGHEQQDENGIKSGEASPESSEAPK